MTRLIEHIRTSDAAEAFVFSEDERPEFLHLLQPEMQQAAIAAAHAPVDHQRDLAAMVRAYLETGEVPGHKSICSCCGAQIVAGEHPCRCWDGCPPWDKIPDHHVHNGVEWNPAVELLIAWVEACAANGHQGGRLPDGVSITVTGGDADV